MKYIEILEKELKENDISWCKGECGFKGHRRGFVLWKDRKTIHYDSKIKTRATLHNALHELGHLMIDSKGLRSYEKEFEAEKFATETMRKYGISVPRRTLALGKSYIKRKKRHGDNIRRGKIK